MPFASAFNLVFELALATLLLTSCAMKGPRIDAAHATGVASSLPESDAHPPASVHNSWFAPTKEDDIGEGIAQGNPAGPSNDDAERSGVEYNPPTNQLYFSDSTVGHAQSSDGVECVETPTDVADAPAAGDASAAKRPTARPS